MTMASKQHVNIKVNGQDREFLVDPSDKLLEVLRREGYSGTKRGCNAGACGSCTVIMDGKIVYSCLLFAFQAHGRSVQTIESMGDFDHPHPLQTALVEEGAVQCGFCIPGIILAAKNLLDHNPAPSDEDLKVHLD
jgi:aerobic carbon-monoxide dehydrogenase small subunit